MFGIFDKIEEFFKDLLLCGIQANLESMFLDINDKVGAVATDVGKTPMGWNGDVFAFIKSINDSVIIPIAGLIITAVLCIELINMVIQKNNLHDNTDTFEFFKYIIKMWIAVWLVSHAFEFSMAVFDVVQHMVNKATGVINTSATVSGDQIVAMMDTLKEKGLGTPATRAGIIENLIYKGFVERDKKNLIATHKGISLVTIVTDTFKSAETTVKWEMELSDIAQGKSSKEEFLKDIENEIKEAVLTYRK